MTGQATPEETGTADSPTLAATLHRQARARSDHPLLICDAERLSYAEAERRSARLARGLIALGAGKGTHVGLLYPNGAGFVVGVLAVARIGAVAVPISTFVTARELREQLVHSDIHILLATASYRSHDYVQRIAEVLTEADFDSVDRLLCTAVPQLRHVAISDGPAAAPCVRDILGIQRLADGVDEALLAAMERDVSGCDPLAIVYTSGSTSAPKGVVHTHAALLGHQRNLNEIRGLTEDDILFCNSPFFWIGGFAFGLLATIVAGSTLLCSNATDAAATLDLLESERPTMTNGFAAGIAHLARHPSFPDRDLSSMRRGNLYPIMPADVRPRDPELRHGMLGMTEAGSVVLLSGDESDQPEHRRGSFGKPAPGFETRIVDPGTGADVAVGEVGELWFRGPYVMQGYYGRSREECFDADGWFHTGDLMRHDADGFVYFIGRSGAMIKTAGANVSPAEVEKAIVRITGGTAHVFGLPHPDRGQMVAAVLTVADPKAFDEAALREKLRAELSAYKVPARFAAVTAADIPLLSSGKVDLRELKKVFDG
ncbi:class I adenylate-forming enzyme family protein [Nocardia wallacei]|uniref:class I adenylate-forming enzyme family protein n=1 Tax=Nocardia wallacei TaxID=480035 RepID=UPI0024562E57|nr:class I adenylate-forming enzyme family protein [Nocardia wallacei]